MKEQAYEEMFHMESYYWWYVGKRKLVFSLLQKLSQTKGRILDVGCGTGFLLEELRRKGYTAFGLENERKVLDLTYEQKIHGIIRGEAENPPFKNDSFDIILLLDLLEHLEDDILVIKKLSEILTKDGYLLVTVPAFSFLWGRHDEIFHHKRRYTAKRLKRIFADAGFTVKKISYTNFFIFPFVLFWRSIKRFLNIARIPETDFWEVPGILNTILIIFYSIEALLIRFTHFPFGVSIICIATRSGNVPPLYKNKISH